MQRWMMLIRERITDLATREYTGPTNPLVEEESDTDSGDGSEASAAATAAASSSGRNGLDIVA